MKFLKNVHSLSNGKTYRVGSDVPDGLYSEQAISDLIKDDTIGYLVEEKPLSVPERIEVEEEEKPVMLPKKRSKKDEL